MVEWEISIAINCKSLRRDSLQLDRDDTAFWLHHFQAWFNVKWHKVKHLPCVFLFSCKVVGLPTS